MGRKGIRVDDDARWVFNRVARRYRARPPYPPALVSRLAALAGEGGAVADLGAGVGHLALPLARAGLRVTAVEPARLMLDELGRAAGSEGLSIERVHAAAEATGLPPGAFDVVLLADALHWVEPRTAGEEIARIGAPGGVLAVVEVEVEPTAFAEAVVAAARDANPRAFPRKRESPADRLAHLVAAAGAGRRRRESFVDRWMVPDEAIPGLLASLSFVGPALGPDGLERVARAAREVAREAGALWARRIGLAYARLR